MRRAHVHVRGQIGERQLFVASGINRLYRAAHDAVVICFVLFHGLNVSWHTPQSDPKIAHLALAPLAASGHTGRHGKTA